MLLGTLLVVLLTVLFVPVRYRLFAEWKNGLYLNGTVSWLLHLIHTRISIEKTKPHIIIRILGFIIYDSERPRKPKKRKNAIKKETSKKKTKVRKAKIIKDSRTTKVTKYDKEIIINTKSNNSELLDNDSEIIEDKIEIAKKINDKDNLENTEDVETKESTDNKEKVEVTRSTVDDTVITDRIETTDTIISNEIHKKEQKKENIYEKFGSKIRYFLRKIKDFFGNLINRFKRLFRSLLDLRRKSGLIIEFFKDEINKDGFRFTFSRIKQLLKHILPRKLKASIRYGTGDPCSTGQILGLLGMLYSFYGDKLQVTPDFENRRLEGWLDAKGRIRLITILIIVIKLMVDRRFKQLKNNWITLKEAL